MLSKSKEEDDTMALMGDNNHLSFAFGILGTIISVVVYLAPLPTFYQIYKRKSTEGFQSLPYLVALFSSMLWLYYALLKPDALLLMINAFGCVIELIYSIMYITYAPRDARKLTIKLFAAMDVGSFALIFLVMNFALHDAHLRVQVLGWVCTSISVSVFAAPLSIVAQVIRTKSVQFMPFNLSLSLILSAVTWFAYGFVVKDICIALPNVVGFILGVLQMLLYAVYRNGDVENEQVVTEEEKEQALEPVINIVVVNPRGSCEVYPIPVDANGDVDQILQAGKKGAEEVAKETEKISVELMNERLKV